MYFHLACRYFVITLLILGYSGYTGAELRLNVSSDGNDDNDGTSQSPLATLEGARNRLREIRKTNPEELKDGAVVYLREGVYSLQTPFVLEEQDSGTETGRIEYRGASGFGGPLTKLVGAQNLPLAVFMPVTDVDVLERITPDARTNILCVDLKALDITELGEFPEAFRTPLAIPELFWGADFPRGSKRMTLARWPNGDEWATISKVVDSGPAPWRNHESPDTGTFEYSGDRPSRWTSAPAVWLYGYWCFDWASETIQVKSIDTEKHHITLSKPHVYGIGSGNPAERRFCALNLLEELDMPGEYYIDRENARLYFWPPGPIKKGSVTLSLLQEPVIQLKDVNYVDISVLDIGCCAGNGIQVEGGNAVHIRYCDIHSTGLNGIVFKGGKNHHIDDCEVFGTGTGGIMVEGGDRKTLTSCGHEVTNNIISDIGIRQRTHAYNVHMKGVGIRLAHNVIRDAPHQAIGLSGNDHIIEFNRIVNVCQESDDCGAFYMGRNPSERGNIIRYNYWQDTGGPLSHGSCAIYLDDGTCGQEIYGNIFLRAAGGKFGAVFVHGGHDNHVYNNIFIDCNIAMGHAPWDDKRWKEWVNGDLWKKRLLEEVDVTKPPYSDRYPELKGFFEYDGEPRKNYGARNVLWDCSTVCTGDWEQENNFETEENPDFWDATIKGGDFQISPGSRIYKKIPGFKAINYRFMGRR